MPSETAELARPSDTAEVVEKSFPQARLKKNGMPALSLAFLSTIPSIKSTLPASNQITPSLAKHRRMSPIATKFGLVAALLSTSAQAAVVPFVKRAIQPHTSNVTLHESCMSNETSSAMLTQALDEAMQIAEFSKQYVLANGADDPLYVKWFGAGDYISVVGAYEGLLSSNKRNVTIRCDNPDGNCAQEGWAGHWRGENATSETVICPLSYAIRQPLSQVCQNNHTVAGSPLNQMFAVDLLHRLWHVPALSDESVSHYADSYSECTELAYQNATWAPFNTHTLQYFALEAYANEVAAPGQGCTGEPASEEDDHDHSSGSATTSAPTACHTHADGTEHCE